MPRFVLLDHDHPQPHLDLMLEVGEVLWTWRLEAPPGEGDPGPAVRIFDHRPLYLDYEGPVSGDRGTVRRRDHGEYDWQEQSPGRLVVRLAGRRLRGRLTLTQEAGDRWRLDFEEG
jgi:hypothetical protein